MSTVLMGNEVSKNIMESVKMRASTLVDKGTVPKICLLRVGEKPDDIRYENSVQKNFDKLGIQVQKIQLSAEVMQEELLKAIFKLNEDTSVHGVLMFRPLPKTIDEDAIRNALSTQKDIDGMSDGSLTGILLNKSQGYAPCTAEACIALLDYYKIDVTGKKVTVVGRSNVIGKPVALMLLNRNATVTVCHSKSENLSKICSQADILICATGRPKMIGEDFVNPKQTVLDVGISVLEDGSVCGDVDFEQAAQLVERITPVPRGIGSITTAILAAHLIDAAEKAHG